MVCKSKHENCQPVCSSKANTKNTNFLSIPTDTLHNNYLYEEQSSLCWLEAVKWLLSQQICTKCNAPQQYKKPTLEILKSKPS